MRRLLILPLLLGFAYTVVGDEPPRITLVSGKPGQGPTVEVTSLSNEAIARLKRAKLEDRQWPECFRIVVAGGTPEEELKRLPMAGKYTLTDGGIRFEPQFPLLPGREYRAFLHPNYDPERSRASDRIEATLAVPRPPPGPRVSIAAVYPSGNRLPENALRFYIQFSGEVARGDVYRHFKLIRDDGVEVQSPFLELDEELWSADGTRLTLLFHPGRVKRELVPRDEDGPVLEQGHSYTLVISDKWEDTEGRPIVSGYRKTFTASPEDNQPIDPMQWSLVLPRAGSDSPLLMRLAKPLDHALLGRLVWVADESGARVPGTLTVGGGERVLTFAPKERWQRGDYRLVVDARLEDVCGNRVGEPFEVDLFKPLTRKIESKTLERKLQVR
jgi:hypothetical protein